MNEPDLNYAIEVLRHEAAAIEGLVSRIDESFAEAARLILSCQGRVVVTGMGKAWLIGQKISATLASTGTPSHAMHAAEALHGDLGRVVRGDIALVISNSGQTRESVELLTPLKALAVPVIAMTGAPDSPLGRNADVVLNLGRLDEACPLNLAPSTTTTAMLALGDALALTVLKGRGFEKEDYAFFHPGGSLGRSLMKVEEIMRQGTRLAVISEAEPLREALVRVTQAQAGAIVCVDGAGKLSGIFTDGDLRRALIRGVDVGEPMQRLMTANPLTIQTGELAGAAIAILRGKHNQLPVVDADGHPVGIVDIQDLVATLA